MAEIFEKNPFLILGVHRSGTSLMSEILTKSSIWMGKNQNIHKEADFFFKINNNLLSENDSNAYDFARMIDKLKDEDYVSQRAVQLEKYIDKKIRFKFFGINQNIKYQFVQEKINWGFKDPRTILLLPIWMKIFPKAKLLFIIRNPIDVCLSIYYFEKKRWAKKLKKRPDLEFNMPLSRAFNIWKNFTRLLISAAEKYHEKSILIRYEELKNPENLQKITRFLENDVKIEQISKIIKNKSSNYKKPDDFTDFLNSVKKDPFVKKIYPNLEY